jgi:hypothetical protein
MALASGARYCTCYTFLLSWPHGACRCSPTYCSPPWLRSATRLTWGTRSQLWHTDPYSSPSVRLRHAFGVTLGFQAVAVVLGGAHRSSLPGGWGQADGGSMPFSLRPPSSWHSYSHSDSTGHYPIIFLRMRCPDETSFESSAVCPHSSPLRQVLSFWFGGQWVHRSSLVCRHCSSRSVLAPSCGIRRRSRWRMSESAFCRLASLN